MVSLQRTRGAIPAIRKFFARQRRIDKGKTEGRIPVSVIGDTKSAGTFEKIARELREEPLSFVVFPGDFVRRGTEGEHRYFKAEFAAEFAFPFSASFLNRILFASVVWLGIGVASRLLTMFARNA
ncbi:MAG: hypothetical protein H3C64_01935 [Candidatus Kuenenia stuttgartiensis]|uniref:hypothetical protein n=1 Tax=Candidatus Kuenenia TaxID=380738 RepID=UPI0002D3ED47|nr:MULTISPECIES: hypothetical protein [Kuenenia]MBE7545880.1 hypothetical protein [Planctomycetia bacterium]MBW7941162.1 hypothetical protein [Candidatus Kuenenia stuttgartiensis]MBZ0193328.1 hypothetical protein [Candidatus Kuenenia stuttgartiensis]MCF6152210.1 hypothetical protein [Candidatus Kuenenia stuttgartiensis]MCL4726766.1 hypothetical protein [Candidatus Kuenenia stuttgartiensis]